MAKLKPKTKRASGKKGISTIKFGEKIGVSKQRVLRAIEAGILSESVKKTPYGESFRYEIDEEIGLREWQANIDPSKQRRESEVTSAHSGNAGAAGFQKAKAMKEFFAAKLAELEYQSRAGKLISADQVEAESFRVGRRVRDSILGVPERVAAELAGMTEPRDIMIYLKEQLAEALKDLGDLDAIGTPKK